MCLATPSAGGSVLESWGWGPSTEPTPHQPDLRHSQGRESLHPCPPESRGSHSHLRSPSSVWVHCPSLSWCYPWVPPLAWDCVVDTCGLLTPVFVSLPAGSYEI